MCGGLHREGLVCSVHRPRPGDHQETGAGQGQGEDGHGRRREDGQLHPEADRACRGAGDVSQRDGVHRAQEGERGGKRWVDPVSHGV